MKNNQKRKKCPRCGKSYVGFPALSRRDNKTDICSKCGTEEAMVDYAYVGAPREWIRDRAFMIQLIRNKK